MAIVLYQVNAFDAGENFIFSFSNSGNQAFKNKLLVKDNTTNITAYESIETTFQLKHTLAGGELSNGNTYNAVVYTYDSENTISTVSNTIIFKTFTTPTWSFINLITDQVVQNSFIQVEMTYAQTEGELLNSYQVELYSSLQTLLYKTNILYDTEDIKATISNLADNTQYYMRAIGTTLNGMSLDTGLIPFSVNYISPALYSLVTLENMPKDGQIKISYNVQLVTGTSNPETPIYIDETKVDLTSEGAYVYFDEGFDVQSNGIFQIKGQEFNDYSVIYEWSNGTDSIELKYMRGTFASQVSEKAYFILRAYNQINNYVIYSNYIDIPLSTDQIHIWIKRINNIYDLKCEILV